jgi:hypothetical protein
LPFFKTDGKNINEGSEMKCEFISQKSRKTHDLRQLPFYPPFPQYPFSKEVAMDKDMEFVIECLGCLFAVLVAVTQDKEMAQFCFERAQIIEEYIKQAKSE